MQRQRIWQPRNQIRGAPTKLYDVVDRTEVDNLLFIK